MKKTLIDSGPLIALFDRDDRFHRSALDFMEDFKGMLITTWPVITEVLHMLDFNVNVQMNFLKWIERGALSIMSLSDKQIPRLIELSEKYSDIPMDLADATMILISKFESIDEIITIDSDFYMYRNIRNKYLVNLFISF